MLGIRRVAGNLQTIYTVGMETGSVPILGRKVDYRRECCWKVTVKVKVNPAVIPPIFKRKQTSTASSGGGGGSSSVSYLTQN
jgi:hypothetical protein